jgi:Fe(3+) dicitrate transport protein
MKAFYTLLITLTYVGVYAQTGTIKGKITDRDGVPVANATVIVEGTSKQTAADETGIYKLRNVPVGSHTLKFSSIGFQSISKAVEVRDGEVAEVDFVTEEKISILEEVRISGVRSITGMGYLDEVHDAAIFAGKKTEVLILDSLDANTAQNNPRQVLGRVPGANYSETEGGGFPSNGIGFRGLNPSQSIETNTRQNGYNITADLYGYPESYYLTPLEAVDRIEVIRGASSLQYGPQFGGVINYITKRGNPLKPFEFTTQQTFGSFGMFNSFNAVGGQIGKLNYYAFGQYQTTNGWRPNSDLKKITGFAKLEYSLNDNLKVGIEYTILRNRIHMPGGLTDSLFNVDSKMSTRARNWIKSPWNILTATLNWKVSANTTLNIKSSFNSSARALVWRNEDGGPQAPDEIDPATGEYVNREVENEEFKSQTTEVRLLTNYKIGNMQNTMASGVRFFTGGFKRQGGGEGTTGSDFDLSLVNPVYEYDLDFTTNNVAPYIENTFRLGSISITPGIRYEYIKSSIKGYNPNETEDGVVNSNASRTRHIFLAGVGAQIKTSSTTNIYANWTQAYRPLDYSSLTPLGTIASVDPNLKDSKGYNADIGYRGSFKDYLNFDVGAFYLRYDNRVGVIEKADALGNETPFRTNIANSVHKGLETYIEFSPTKAFLEDNKWNLSFFNSLAIIDAKYVSGEYSGKYVEYAPTSINRFGATLSIGSFSTTYLISSTAKSYGDATNSVEPSEDAVTGLIPSYTVMDLSATYRYKKYNVKVGVNNLSDARYFTKRTDEYPGPGIIPSVGRSFYVGLGARF